MTGPRVLVARAPHQSGRLSTMLRQAGCEPVEVPLLAIDPPSDGGAALRAAAGELLVGTVAAVGLTSPNGVRALALAVAVACDQTRALDRAGDDVAGALAQVCRPVFESVHVAAVGPGTARAVRAWLGVDADDVAPVHTTRGLAAVFPAPDVIAGGRRVVLPRADIATPELAETLAAAGWDVVDVQAYRTRLCTTVPPAVRADLINGDIAAVAAGSPSTVDALVSALDGQALGAALVAIGPVTGARAAHRGLEVAAEADPHNLDGLVAAVAGVVH